MEHTFKATEQFDSVDETGIKSSGPSHMSSHASPSLGWWFS